MNIFKEGGITQLVECMLCKHKVIGSSPVISINMLKKCLKVFWHIFGLFGGIGRHVRLKIWFWFKSIGSSPITSIFYIKIFIKTKMMKLVDMLGLGSSSYIE